VDDLSDVRPGRRAAEEAGARAPLAEAGMTKEDVRALSRAVGLPTWDLPASPCLASRLPYGTLVTAGALRRVEAAERAVRALGFRELRVRHLGETGRLEVAPEELLRLADGRLRRAVEEAVRGAGYTRVDIDPQGYRRGRLNGERL
ncbi:MAG TPA: TIGR00268 family protein, partial [Vicinamibacteria bacterium]|nr:TIGR00268 family protein [Vicinamibacteria bacterium]